MLDYILITFGIIAIIGGILGCVLPVIPGPPLSYAGLLFLHFTSMHQFTANFLIIWAVITTIVYVLDFIIPSIGTKKSGGSKAGVYGSLTGLVAGLLLFPPLGIIIGPFAGAVLGELISGKSTISALKSGFGSFIGFIAGTLLKLIVSGLMTWHFGKELLFG